MTVPAQTPYEEISALRCAILKDIEDRGFASEIAKRHNVTMATALALVFKPEQVTLCRFCRASGIVIRAKDGIAISEPCKACAGVGYTTGVTIA